MSTFTDLSYDLIERIEQRKRRLTFVIIACMILAPLGLATSAFAFMLFSHQKGSFSDLSTVIIATNMVLCSFFVIIGADRYNLLKKWKTQTKEFELLEETIYQEVLSSK